MEVNNSSSRFPTGITTDSYLKYKPSLNRKENKFSSKEARIKPVFKLKILFLYYCNKHPSKTKELLNASRLHPVFLMLFATSGSAQ